MPARRADVFSYGLFMDQDVLRAKGLAPEGAELASVSGFALRIGRRAALVPQAPARVYGVVMSLTLEEKGVRKRGREKEKGTFCFSRKRRMSHFLRKRRMSHFLPTFLIFAFLPRMWGESLLTPELGVCFCHAVYCRHRSNRVVCLLSVGEPALSYSRSVHGDCASLSPFLTAPLKGQETPDAGGTRKCLITTHCSRR